MKVLQCDENAYDEKFFLIKSEMDFTCLVFCEFALFAEVVPQVTALEEIHDEVKVLSVLEGCFHVHDEGVLEVAEEIAFIHDRVDAFFGDDSY